MSNSQTPQAAISAGIDLMRLVGDRDDLDQKIAQQVREVIAQGGTWTTVAVALGVTKQAAHKRYASTI